MLYTIQTSEQHAMDTGEGETETTGIIPHTIIKYIAVLSSVMILCFALLFCS
jgi:hypothetical protein